MRRSMSPHSTTPTQILGACPHDCPDTCSMVTTVQDGIAIAVHGIASADILTLHSI